MKLLSSCLGVIGNSPRCAAAHQLHPSQTPAPPGVQFEQDNMDVWRMIVVPPEQRKIMAGLWSRWVAQRQGTHDRMRALAHALHALPLQLDVPNDFLLSLAHGFPSGRAAAATACLDLNSSAFNLAVFRAAPPPHAWTRKLVGVCPRATAAAGALLQQLRQAHIDDANAFAAFNCLINCSGDGFRVEQAVRIFAGTPSWPLAVLCLGRYVTLNMHAPVSRFLVERHTCFDSALICFSARVGLCTVVVVDGATCPRSPLTCHLLIYVGMPVRLHLLAECACHEAVTTGFG
jgi:hypothetical protein